MAFPGHGLAPMFLHPGILWSPPSAVSCRRRRLAVHVRCNQQLADVGNAHPSLWFRVVVIGGVGETS